VSIIQNYLNKELLKDFAIRHNLPLDKSMIEMKNEFLFSKYYSLNVKKKYATKVIAQEGKPFSFMDIKGLETRRSDIPTVSKEMLQKLLEMIFDGVKISKLKTYVSEIEDRVRDLASNGDPCVAKPVSFSKEETDYKSMPEHLKAMLIWNCIVNDDFRHGSKGRLFKVKSIDLQKAPEKIQNNYTKQFLAKYTSKNLTAIVIPEDIKKLPEYFIPDVNAIIEFAVHDRANLLLEPLVKKADNIILF
jgi:hypothetical protein